MKDARRSTQDSRLSWHKRLTTVFFEFVILFAFWIILSGHYTLKYIVLGALSAALVTLLTNDLVYPLFIRADKGKGGIRISLLQFWRFLAYLPWLLYKIIMANLQVAYLVLHPRMPIEPVLLQFRTRLRRSLAQVILANSITLTPGTVTAYLADGRYVIHVLVPSSASEILEARMQNKVGAIFLEEVDNPPAALWAHSLKELEE